MNPGVGHGEPSTCPGHILEPDVVTSSFPSVEVLKARVGRSLGPAGLLRGSDETKKGQPLPRPLTTDVDAVGTVGGTRHSPRIGESTSSTSLR